MPEKPTCERCGAALLGAADGLCPRCLMGMAISPTRSMAGPVGAADSGPSADVVGFNRAILGLKLLGAEDLERIARTVPADVAALAGALVRAGKLTPFQAGALARGKTRGLVIGNYFILDKLGAGGMGVVFKAKHRRLGRIVALKILPPALARDPDLLSRFRREVDVAASLSHPHIVAILDADEDRGVHFMTMEYIEGSDLDRLVRDRGALDFDLALDCAIQAARGLEAAHARGIVHRDIKPGNLMLDGSGVVRVLDLGLARAVGAPDPRAETTPKSLTQSGTCVGTVDFMAPEQGLDSRRVDHRADIYSLGCTLCFLMTGRPPFEGENLVVKLMAHQNLDARSLRIARPDIPAAIDAAYLAMMSKKPDDRPATMSQVIAILEACRTRPGAADEARTGLRSIAANAVRPPSLLTGELTAAPRRPDVPADPTIARPAKRGEDSARADARDGPNPGRDPATVAGPAPVGSTPPPMPPREPSPTEPVWEDLIDFKESEGREDISPEPEETDERRLPDWLWPVAAGSAVTLALLVASWATGVIRFGADAPKASRSPTVASRGPGLEPKREDGRESVGRLRPARGPDPGPEIAATERAVDEPPGATPPTAPAPLPSPPLASPDPPRQGKPVEVAAAPPGGPAKPDPPTGFVRAPRKIWIVDALLPQFNEWIAKLEPDGYRPIFVNSHVAPVAGSALGLQVRIAAIAVKERPALPFRVVQTLEKDHFKRFVAEAEQGYRLDSMTSYPDSPTGRTIGLYSKRITGGISHWTFNIDTIEKNMPGIIREDGRIFSVSV